MRASVDFSRRRLTTSTMWHRCCRPSFPTTLAKTNSVAPTDASNSAAIATLHGYTDASGKPASPRKIQEACSTETCVAIPGDVFLPQATSPRHAMKSRVSARRAKLLSVDSTAALSDNSLPLAVDATSAPRCYRELRPVYRTHASNDRPMTRLRNEP